MGRLASLTALPMSSLQRLRQGAKPVVAPPGQEVSPTSDALDRNGVAAVLRAKLPESVHDSINGDLLDALFTMFDRNRDGEVSSRELVRARRLYCRRNGR